MNIQELKRYIEKELKAKRFLVETLQDVEALEALEQRSQELNGAVAGLHEDHVSILDAVALAHSTLVDAQSQLAVVQAQIADTVTDAKAQAKTIKDNASQKAQQMIDKAAERVADVDVQIALAEEKLNNTRFEHSEVVAQVESIKTEKAKLLAKLGG